MRYCWIFHLFILAICFSLPAQAFQNKNYNPLFQYQKSGGLPIDAWSSSSSSQSGKSYTPTTRPQLSGLWSRDVELLEDSLLRKHGRLLQGSHSKAKKLIVKSYPKNMQSTARLRGFFAEAVYLDRHPNEHYVSKSNAPYNDVYVMKNGVPNGAQIKTKITFSGPAYEADMRKDYKAKRFIIPDDHVQPFKVHLTEQEKIYRGMGDIKNADRTQRMIAKVLPLGATTKQLQSRLDSVYRTLARAENAHYVSLGASAGLGLAPILWKYTDGETTEGAALYQATRTMSLVGAGLHTDKFLTNFKDGALRGTVKGNVITGATIFAVETAYLIYEHGSTQSFKQAAFWEEIGGSVSSLALGFTVGGTVGVWVTTMVPAMPWIGVSSAVVAGSVSSIAGYVGGKSATRALLAEVAPEIALQSERDAVKEARESLNTMKSKLLTI